MALFNIGILKYPPINSSTLFEMMTAVYNNISSINNKSISSEELSKYDISYAIVSPHKIQRNQGLEHFIGVISTVASGAITVALPDLNQIFIGDCYIIADLTSNASLYTITLNSDGNKINNTESNPTITANNGQIKLLCVDKDDTKAYFFRLF